MRASPARTGWPCRRNAGSREVPESTRGRYDRIPVASRDELHAEILALQRRVAELESAATRERTVEHGATLEAILESASQGIVVIDAGGCIALANERLATMFGYRGDEIVGRTLEVLVPTDLRAIHTEHRTRYAANPHVRPMGAGLDLTGQRKDGTRFPVEISLSYADTTMGRLSVGFVTDISERKRVEEAL